MATETKKSRGMTKTQKGVNLYARLKKATKGGEVVPKDFINQFRPMTKDENGEPMGDRGLRTYFANIKKGIEAGKYEPTKAKPRKAKAPAAEAAA